MLNCLPVHIVGIYLGRANIVQWEITLVAPCPGRWRDQGDFRKSPWSRQALSSGATKVIFQNCLGRARRDRKHHAGATKLFSFGATKAHSTKTGFHTIFSIVGVEIRAGQSNEADLKALVQENRSTLEALALPCREMFRSFP